MWSCFFNKASGLWLVGWAGSSVQPPPPAPSHQGQKPSLLGGFAKWMGWVLNCTPTLVYLKGGLVSSSTYFRPLFRVCNVPVSHCVFPQSKFIVAGIIITAPCCPQIPKKPKAINSHCNHFSGGSTVPLTHSLNATCILIFPGCALTPQGWQDLTNVLINGRTSQLDICYKFAFFCLMVYTSNPLSGA